MARAKAGTGFILVVGLLAGAAPTAAPASDDAPRVAQLFGSKPSRALGDAIEAQRHGDYERAAALLQDAAAGQASLTQTEQQELGRLMKDNAVALDGRRAAAEQLRLAQNALKDKRQTDAIDLLKRVAANEQYLTAADRQAFRKCSTGLNLPGAGGPPEPPPAAPPTAAATNGAQARLLVQQARTHLVQGDLDQAEKEAKDAAALKVVFARNEDSPLKVLDDLSRSSVDASALLKASRAALQRKDFDRAERYAHQSEKASSTWSLTLWGDTPAKALKDIQSARVASLGPRTDARKSPVGQTPSKPEMKKPDAPVAMSPLPKPEMTKPAAGPTTVQASKPAEVETASAALPSAPVPAPAAPPSPKNTDKARELLAQARKAIQFGDLASARKLIDEARALKPDLQWYEDNPDKLQAEVARAEMKARPPAVVAAAKDKEKGKPAPADAKAKATALLRQGRQQLNDNKLDDAVQTVVQVRLIQGLSWGLFEDSPEKLRQDVEAARLKHDKEESIKVLAEARTLIQKGDYVAAERAAYRAQTLHGPYSVWDFGDRPSKVLADLDTARATRKGPLDKPAPDLAKKDADKTAVAVNKVDDKRPAAGADDQARRMLADARKALAAGDAARATQLAQQVKTMHVALNRPGDENPDALLADARAMDKGRPIVPPAPPSMAVAVNTTAPPVAPDPSQAGPPAPPTPVADANKAKAVQLLQLVHELERQNKLLEARERAVEAAQLHASFGPTEESPELALQELNGMAHREVSRLMTQASDAVTYGEGDPLARCAKAQQNLLQARELVAAFGQDGRAVEDAMARVSQVRGIVLKQPGAAQGTDVARATPPVLAPVALPASVGPPPAAPVPVNPPAPVVAPTASAVASDAPPTLTPEQQLDMARRELNRGSTGTARKIAEEVYSNHVEVRGEAEAVIRSIDAEETAQQARRDRKTFDAAVSSYNLRDYAHAQRLIASIDVRRLDPVRLGHLREMEQTPDMQPNRGPVLVAAVGGEGVGAKEATPSPQPAQDHGPDAAPGRARATDDPGVNLLKSTEAMRQIKFQQLRADGLDVQRRAQEKASANQTEVAIDMLQQYLNGLDNEQLEPAQLTLLRGPVVSRLQKFKIMQIQDGVAKADAGDKEVQQKHRQDKLTAERNKEQNVAELMKQFNDALKAGKYPEAERAANMAHELDPDNPATTAAMMIAKLTKNKSAYDKIKGDKERLVLDELNDATREGPALTSKDPIYVDPEIEKRNHGKRLGFEAAPVKSEKERDIEHRLTTPVTMNFSDAPLHQVVDDLRATQGMNIYVDQQALDAENVSLEHPVSIKLDQVSLKSALNLILKSVHLTYIIKDEVLQITTESQAKGKLLMVTYQVADLVIPVPNSAGVIPPIATTGQLGNPPAPYQPTPVPGPYAVTGGTPTGTPTGSPFATDLSGATITKTAPQTREEQLIKLITNAVEPRSWSDLGGSGTIDYHPLTMGLVINQTPDIQEQIQDLLNSLRRLQDQEVALEVRFISISDDFFERIGVDFAINITNNQANTAVGQQLTSGIFKPAGFLNTFTPNNVVAGVAGPGGTLTNGLNIPITSNTIQNTIPPFGGYVPGFSVGLAFLSQIQVFLFMEAVQGDNRVNVMQAPRLTAFNGQTATLQVSDEQPFVTNVSVTIGPTGTPIFQPTVQTGGSTVNLTIQPVISADRRFVRLNFGSPQQAGGVGVGQQGNATGGVTLINIVPGPVQTFPIVVPVFAATPLNGNTDPNQTIVFTQLIQQPVQQIINITTTVSVPDGGTVVMGGLKRLEESRSEYGPPILSKIPYINRLFKNTGYGRSAESLLIMVTPRIIIQEEEEERQTGFNINAATGTAGGP